MTAGVRLAVALLVGVIALAAGGVDAGAQDAARPTVTVDRAAMRPGEQVVVTLTGWQASVVTLSVCGNQAARGSSDCNMVASEGIRRNRDGSVTSRDFVVVAPAAPCPCVLRVSTATNDEVAITPIDLIGHPTGPIVLPATRPRLQVSVHARKVPRGVLQGVRAALGGPTPYDVTVTVRNPSTLQFDHVVVAGSAHRGGNGDVTPLELPLPGPLGPGQSWTHTVRSTVPAPVFGTFAWEITASGAGPSVTTTASERNTPFGLLVVLVVLVVDVIAIVWRRMRRRRASKSDEGVHEQLEPPPPTETGPAERLDLVTVSFR